MKISRYLIGLAAVSSIFAFTPAAFATTFESSDAANSSVSSTGDISGDAWFAANTVTISHGVMGELFAAGSTVTVEKPVARSIFAAGGSVTSHGSGYNAYVAGSTVVLHGVYANSVYVAGSSVEIADDAVINGDLYVAGSNVVIRGEVKGYVRVSASSLTFSGNVGQSITGNLQKLVGEGGTVSRDIEIKGRQLSVVDQAKIAIGGALRTTELPAPSVTSQFSGRLMSLLGTLLLIMLIVWRYPVTSDKLVEQVKANHAKWVFRGIGAAIVIPIIAIALLVSGAGAPIGVLLLLTYIFAMILSGAQGYLLLTSYLSRQLGNSNNPYTKPLIVGFVVALLGLLPGLGMLVMFVVGIGFAVPSFAAIMWAMAKKE